MQRIPIVENVFCHRPRPTHKQFHRLLLSHLIVADPVTRTSVTVFTLKNDKDKRGVSASQKPLLIERTVRPICKHTAITATPIDKGFCFIYHVPFYLNVPTVV